MAKFTPAQRKARLDELIQTYGIKMDPQDYKWCLGRTWHHALNEKGYPTIRTAVRKNGRVKHVKLHRFIMFRKNHRRWWPKSVEVAHLNGNHYDLRRSNLELQTHLHNVKLNKKNSTGYPNVFKNKRSGSFYVQILVNGKLHYLGSYINIEDAVIVAYDAAREYHKVAPPQTYYDLLKKFYGEQSC